MYSGLAEGDRPGASRGGWSTHFLVVALAFAASAVTCCVYLTGEGSLWIRMTQPYEPLHAANSLLGFSSLLSSAPFHLENISFVRQTAMFSGLVLPPPDLYFVRPLYGFFAALFVPLVGIVGAMLLTNTVCWSIAVACTWRLAWQFWGDRLTATLAALFAVAGFGFVAHIGDYSAHLMAFTCSFVAITVLHSSRVWRERRPLRVHVSLGLMLALCCLQYNTGVSLTLAYAFLAWRHNHRGHVVMAAVIALLAQRLWVAELNVVHMLSDHSVQWHDLYGTENTYLARSLLQWAELAREPVALVRAFLSTLASFASFEAPWVVASGLFAVWRLRKVDGFGRFVTPIIALPVLAGMAYGQYAPARGYLVYGISIVLYVALARLAVDTVRARRTRVGQGIATIAACVLLVAQWAWAGAALAGNPGPAKYYFLGGSDNLAMTFHPPASASLAGGEAVPRLFGGNGTLADAGAFAETSEEPIATLDGDHPGAAVVLRGVIAVYLAAAVWGMAGSPGTAARRGIVTGAILLVVAPVAVGQFLPSRMPHFRMIHGLTLPVRGRTLTYDVTLAPAMLERLGDLAARSARISVYFGGPDADFRQLALVRARDERLLVQRPNGLWDIPVGELVGSLDGSGHLLLRALIGSTGSYRGWQRNDRPGRRVIIDQHVAGTAELAVLPALEMRFLGVDGRTLFILF